MVGFVSVFSTSVQMSMGFLSSAPFVWLRTFIGSHLLCSCISDQVTPPASSWWMIFLMYLQLFSLRSSWELVCWFSHSMSLSAFGLEVFLPFLWSGLRSMGGLHKHHHDSIWAWTAFCWESFNYCLNPLHVIDLLKLFISSWFNFSKSHCLEIHPFLFDFLT